MEFPGFTTNDFQVFTIDGLEPRMEALQQQIRPKLEALGHFFSQELGQLTGDEMFYHVAKHARRTVNPPDDTWVAFANNKRGYKKHPHFQIGLWETHVFVWYAVIYEAPRKAEIGSFLEMNISSIRETIPSHFVWSDDHTKPSATKMADVSDEQLLQLFQRLQSVKKAEILCGIHLHKEDVINMSGTEFLDTVYDTFVKLIPLYQLS
ncbi:DUF1054 domain-containing protein [Bacillus sp. REN10]|uniref:YktB family protein n=1 Tax=Bacillus sp. REN10 TaxID=2782541 RepID=UPI00193B5BD7|nr:DUF1054 domain-containing protein [Bacillus sp. REN10]